MLIKKFFAFVGGNDYEKNTLHTAVRGTGNAGMSFGKHRILNRVGSGIAS